MTYSIASGLKENRRLATFHLEDAEEFYRYLKTRYDSEVESWLAICPQDSWKYPILETEWRIRILERRIRYLESQPEIW